MSRSWKGRHSARNTKGTWVHTLPSSGVRAIGLVLPFKQSVVTYSMKNTCKLFDGRQIQLKACKPSENARCHVCALTSLKIHSAMPEGLFRSWMYSNVCSRTSSACAAIDKLRRIGHHHNAVTTQQTELRRTKEPCSWQYRLPSIIRSSHSRSVHVQNS